MKRAIFAKFIQILLLALALNSVIFSIVTSSVLLKNSRNSMLYTLKVVDSMLDYDKDLNQQAKKLSDITSANQNRFTMIGLDGSVAAETGLLDVQAMGNHLEREEVQDALVLGNGYARRYSRSLKVDMLYVAYRSPHADYVLRLAMPYTGSREYLVMLLPAIFLSFAVALLGSAFSAEKFANSVTKPLMEISKEMIKVNGNYADLKFEQYQYPEINVIADTTTEMSKNVKESLGRLELEKQIRQEFFSNASHELKTPITSIQGYAELIESGMIPDETVRMDFIKRIKQEAVNMAGLINDILMISRLEAKEAVVVMTKIRIAPLLEEVIQSLKPMAAVSQVFVNTDVRPLTIQANLQQMKELLGNLLGNAVKYNRQGGQVWVTICQEDQDLLIRVKDTGVGIPEESLTRIFERFYRVDKGRSKKQGGTGLGLAIVKHIVNYYKGSIEVTSKMDEGTEFVVRLPDVVLKC